MGKFVLNINYADSKEAELLQCLRDAFGKVTIEGPHGEPAGDRDKTPEEIRQNLERKIKKELESMFLRWKGRQLDGALD